MIKILPILYIFILTNLFSQNLVPNGSFEIISDCPSAQGQINLANGWGHGNEGTSDLYNACSVGSRGVPSNILGFQEAVEGNSYSGLFTYAKQSQSTINGREYVNHSC